MISRRAVLAAAALPVLVRAQAAWPERPVRWIVGYAPGGASDAMARLIGNAMQRLGGQNFVFDNRPGAGAIVATEQLVRAPADAHTIMTIDNGIMVYNPALYARLPFDPDREIRPVGFIGRFPLMLLVKADHPAADFSAFRTRAAAAAPTYGTPGVASPHHLAMEKVRRVVGFNVTHVPYRGGPPAMNDLLAGTVDSVVMDTSTGAPFVRDGRVRALCCFNEARMQALPDVPTLVELGFSNAVAYGWQGVGVQAATPDATVAAINRLLLQAIASEEVSTRLRGIAVETVADDPARFAAFIQRENAEWRPLIRDLGIRLDS